MSGGDRLSYLLIGRIAGRILAIKQSVARLAARIAAGTYAPRRFARRRSPGVPRPRPPDTLPRTFGWLLPLVPEAVVFRAQLESLLQDPEMAGLLAAAPASLARPIRSLCWMLRVDPPPILAPPRPAAPPPAQAAAATPPPRRPPPATAGLSHAGALARR
jgi:hypothetical protein